MARKMFPLFIIVCLVIAASMLAVSAAGKKSIRPTEYKHKDLFTTIINPAPSEGFFWGFQMTNGTQSFYPWTGWDVDTRMAQAARDIKGCNAGWTRLYLIWGEVEAQTEKSAFTGYLGVPRYPSVNEVSDQMIEDYAFNQGAWSGENANNWYSYDCAVRNLTDNGVGIFMDLGLGDKWAVPLLAETGEKIQPDSAGRDAYLGLLYLHARGAVRRYGPRVQYYQLEDELNAGYLRGVVFYKVRTGPAWRDEGFKVDLLDTMSRAVLDEGSSLGLAMYRMVYLHTFLSDRVLTPWTGYVKRWAPYYDLVGLDIYPDSYTLGFVPQLSACISVYIDLTVGALERAGYRVGVDKFVYVNETSFPTEPCQRGYNESNQARAILAAVKGNCLFGKGVLGTRASGFCWGALTGTETATMPWWELGYTDPFMGIVKPGEPVRYTEAYDNLGDAISTSGRTPLEYPVR